MRLLHVISSIDPRRGGPMEGVRQLSGPLERAGHRVEVVCVDSPSVDFVKTFNVKVHALGPSLLKYSYSRKLLPWLRENASNYDAIIVNGIWTYHSFAAWRALHKLKVPYFVFTHGMLDPWFKHRYPMKHLKKWLYWPWAEYRVLRDAAGVIFTCEEERLLARQSFWLYDVQEAVGKYGTTLPPQAAEQYIRAFLTRFPECVGKELVLYLGRMHEKKGPDLLLEAFAAVRENSSNMHLVMAGPTDDFFAQQLMQMIRGSAMAEHITWTGMLQGEMKWGAFHSCSLFCLPSHQENFGIAVAEALGCGKPVLISNKVNIWREIESSGAGIIVEDSLDSTVEGLISWAKLDSVGRDAMSAAAKNCFMKYFHIDQAALRLEEIILDRLAVSM